MRIRYRQVRAARRAQDAARAAEIRMPTAVGVESEAQLPFAGLHQILLGAAVLRWADEPATRLARSETRESE